jgi:hypothetical protein
MDRLECKERLKTGLTEIKWDSGSTSASMGNDGKHLKNIGFLTDITDDFNRLQCNVVI